MDIHKTTTHSRIFLIRHGETDWSKGGKHTARTEVPLSKTGEEHMLEARDAYIGPGKLIDPADVRKIYVSPRGRARRSCELLNLGADKPVDVTERLKEWDYGEYEGLTIQEVHELRKSRGLENNDPQRTWNIWIDGCEGGESPQDVSDRLDNLIAEILGLVTATIKESSTGLVRPKNVVCIAHGHVLASFALRWAQQPLQHGLRLLMETAGVAVLGFEHDDVREPGVILGRRAGL